MNEIKGATLSLIALCSVGSIAIICDTLVKIFGK